LIFDNQKPFDGTATMPRPKKTAPDYRYHMSGQAVVTFNQKNFYLGPHNSPQSYAKYHRLVAEYIATGKTPSEETHQAETPITVADVTAEARAWIAEKYPEGTAENYRLNNLCTTLDDEYGDNAADEFGPRKLSEIRDLLIASGNCRKYINSQIRGVIRIFRYALSRELIDSSTLIKLQSLEPLRYGKTKARESVPVESVNLDDVRATVRHLSPTVRAMVRIQAATGMRPSELCIMRPADVERVGPVWLYKPQTHKTRHLGKSKAVPIGGDAKDALKPFLERGAEEYCFSPEESAQWHRDQRTAKRVTPMNEGNKIGSNRKPAPARKPGAKFSPESYRRAVKRAAEKAKVKHWFPYMLRHLAAEVVQDALGVEHAQHLLGHSRPSMTAHYAKRSTLKAIEAAAVTPSVGAV
jgi:integrase